MKNFFKNIRRRVTHILGVGYAVIWGNCNEIPRSPLFEELIAYTPRTYSSYIVPISAYRSFLRLPTVRDGSH